MPDHMASKLIICLTGMPGSGKSTVANMLKRRGFYVLELSSSLHRLMRMCGFKVNTKTREFFTAKLKKEFGHGILAKLSADSILRLPRDVVVSGVRNVEEIAYIRTLSPHVAVIAVSVPRRTRYERLSRRKDIFKISSYREFEWRDRKNVALGTLKVVRSADYVLANTGTLPQLHSDLDELLAAIRNKKRG